jgi:hypothetical protein
MDPQIINERRREPRYRGGGLPCFVAGLDMPGALDSAVIDFSSRGIGLMLDQRVPVGMFLEVALFDLERGAWLHKAAQVIHTRSESDGWYHAGGGLLVPLSGEEMERLIEAGGLA